jgi:uncharacterized membrane protein (DUF485 family)
MITYRRFALACIVAMLVVPARAQAYLDPSSGSMMLQIAVGGFLAALVTAKVYWRKAVSIFRRKHSPE